MCVCVCGGGGGGHIITLLSLENLEKKETYIFVFKVVFITNCDILVNILTA